VRDGRHPRAAAGDRAARCRHVARRVRVGRAGRGPVARQRGRPVMTVTLDSPFVSPPRIRRATFVRVLTEAGSPWADRAGEIHDLIVAGGHDPAVWLAICAEEHTFGTN